MESTTYYENTVLERPKQLNIGGNEKYCSILVCKNAQYDKEWQKMNIGLFKIPNKYAKPKLYTLRCNKIKTFRRTAWKDSLKVTNNTYVCGFYFHITDINVSVGRHIKTLKPHVAPSAFRGDVHTHFTTLIGTMTMSFLQPPTFLLVKLVQLKWRHYYKVKMLHYHT